MDSKYSYKYLDEDVDCAEIYGWNAVNICVMQYNVTHLSIRHCKKLEIIRNFSNTLIDLYINGCIITYLEKLPLNLKVLYCANNNIKYIDNFPASLEKCTCYSNNLLYLPIKSNLIKLQQIWCYCNKITGPFYMPTNLYNLEINHNNLTSIQNIFPNELNNFNFNINKLAHINVVKLNITHVLDLNFRCNFIKFINYKKLFPNQKNVHSYCFDYRLDYRDSICNNNNYYIVVYVRDRSYYCNLL